MDACMTELVVCGVERNYIDVCTVKPHDVLEVKNAFVKSSYCVMTVCTACCLVLIYV
jgi:hypothetical protein